MSCTVVHPWAQKHSGTLREVVEPKPAKQVSLIGRDQRQEGTGDLVDVVHQKCATRLESFPCFIAWLHHTLGGAEDSLGPSLAGCPT